MGRDGGTGAEESRSREGDAEGQCRLIRAHPRELPPQHLGGSELAHLSPCLTEVSRWPQPKWRLGLGGRPRPGSGAEVRWAVGGAGEDGQAGPRTAQLSPPRTGRNVDQLRKHPTASLLEMLFFSHWPRTRPAAQGDCEQGGRIYCLPLAGPAHPACANLRGWKAVPRPRRSAQLSL